VAHGLHILVGNQNVASWLLLFIYVRTPPTHYYLKYSGQMANMETHLKSSTIQVHLLSYGALHVSKEHAPWTRLNRLLAVGS
jgi:hypothetical protein